MVQIADVDGINERHADRLKSIGIATSDDLLIYGASRRGRRELAKATGLGEKRIAEWIKRADLLRVPGVSGRFANLLEAAGIDQARDLKRRNPAKLRGELVELNKKRSIVGRVPGESEVGRWVDAAKDLPTVIKRW